MGTNQAIKTKIKLLAAAATLSLSTLLTACGDAEATNGEKEKKETVIAVPVEVAALENGSISSNYVTTAVLEAKEEAFVVARASSVSSQNSSVEQKIQKKLTCSVTLSNYFLV